MIKFYCHILHIPSDTKSTILLEALKNNRSIKHLRLNSNDFSESTAHAFAQTLMNKQTLLSLDMSVVPYPVQRG